MRGFVKIAGVAAMCAAVAMIGGFASTKSIHKGRAFNASLGGTLYNCNFYGTTGTSSTKRLADCSGNNGSQGTYLCMKDEAATFPGGPGWRRFISPGGMHCSATGSTTSWTQTTQWVGAWHA